jgi:hypothetical protein
MHIQWICKCMIQYDKLEPPLNKSTELMMFLLKVGTRRLMAKISCLDRVHVESEASKVLRKHESKKKITTRDSLT